MVHDEARLGHLDPIGFSLFDFFRYKIVYFEHMPRARCVDLEVGGFVEVGAGTGD